MNDNTEKPAEPAELPPAPPKRQWNDHHITIRSPEKLREAWEFARDNDMLFQFSVEFMNMLALVAGFTKEADAIGYDLHGFIGYDGSLHSFGWFAEAVGPLPAVPMRHTVRYMNGGLIYHGRGSGETFSMTLTSGTERPWQIHS